jgi:NADH-quinone oxidoreductase subunit G
MVEIEINGKKVEAAPGAMIIEVADQEGVRIPRFCYHKKLSIAANCRMCLVEVGDVRKPLPACATPVSQGMKVFTRSKLALDAQRAVMEFLLINHPLDCPVCDQGGECELQDLAMGYGRDISRFHLGKRSVADRDIGPLIETEMTRCIHCTRCVRFGKEIAGVQELGVMNRGEHLEISTFVEKALVSELSGNMIDVCPVGALTSKPYRFTARAWELSQRPSIAAHDCVGSHIYAHVIHNEIKRVVPKECEALNEMWLSDRDRFSYEGLYHEDRVLTPKIKRNGQWEETDWPIALQFAADKLREANADSIGALVSENATTEEFYLLQKLIRGLGSANIDHRLAQQDFSDQENFMAYPHAGLRLDELAQADVILLLGSNVRKEQPMIAHRIRMATRNHTKVLVVNPIDYVFNFPVTAKQIATGGDLLQALGKVAKALLSLPEFKGQADAKLSAFLKEIVADDAALAQARYLIAAKQGVILLGALALNHPQASGIRGLADFISQQTSVKLGFLTAGANTSGAWLMGALPHRLPGAEKAQAQGLNAQAMLSGDLKTLLLLGVEPEYDAADSGRALEGLANTACVIALHAYQTPHLLKYAHVILPITPAAEMAGTFINHQGDWQTFSALTNPQGQSRPAWKILRVIANLLEVGGFDYQDIADVQKDINTFAVDKDKTSSRFTFSEGEKLPQGLVRISSAPIYAQDCLVRRAQSLQQTPEALFTGVHINKAQASALGILDAQKVVVRQNAVELRLPLILDETIPMNAVYLASHIRETLGLGRAYQAIQIEQVQA